MKDSRTINFYPFPDPISETEKHENTISTLSSKFTNKPMKETTTTMNEMTKEGELTEETTIIKEKIENCSLEISCYIKNILSPSECITIIEAAEKNGLKQQMYFGENKDSSFCTIWAPELSDIVFSRISNLLEKETYFDSGQVVLEEIDLKNQNPSYIGTIDGCYPFVTVVKYETGQSLKIHRDSCRKVKGKESYTVYSLTIYLNDGYEGGHTYMCKSKTPTQENELYDLIKIKGKRGDALLLRQEILHKGGVVLSGCKYILRVDINYKLNKDHNEIK